MSNHIVENKSLNSNSELLLSRKYSYVSSIILVDGVPDAGKAVIDNVVSTFSRVEITKVSKIIENICILYYLKIINENTAETLIKTELDQTLYDLMMSRNLNFRLNDQTSVFKSLKKLKYLTRIFNKGDRYTPIDIRKQKPILHLLTHNIIGISEPFINIFDERLTIIDTVRHPKSVYNKQLDYLKKWSTASGIKRQFNTWLKSNNIEIPWFFHEHESLYYDLNLYEKVIFIMHKYNDIKEKFIVNNSKFIKSRCITVPFEHFVVSPWNYIDKIENKLDVCSSNRTKIALKKMNIPRQNIRNNVHLQKIDELIKIKVNHDFIKEYFYELCRKYEDNYCI